ncbi:hypothetical protein C8J56DRAFT_1034954 [Mycena floridula]|nr:hypothetical protein C8J56DRAFT_1034954 [Mycena floridula]
MNVCSECGSFRLDLSPDQSSNLKQLLRGNHHPRVSSRGREISQLLSAARHELDCLDHEIFRMQEKIITLTNQRVHIQRNITGYQSLLSPIRMLPTEVLRLIFSFHCHTNIVSDNLSIPGRVLGAVSSHWREVTMKMRQIWSNISVAFEAERISRDHMTDSVAMLLKRSGDLPLTLTLSSSRDEEDNDIHPTLLLLARHTHRWRHVVLRQVWLPPSISSEFPILEYLDVDSRNSNTRIFRIAPKLNNVALRSTASTSVVLPFSQIQHLEMQYVSVTRMTATLAQSTHLRKASLQPTYPQSNDVGEEPKTLSLTTLKLESQDWTWKHILILLSRILLPELRDLTIISPCNTEPFPLNEIRDFLILSSCSVTRLFLQKSTIRSSSLISLLASLPSLKEFIFHEKLSNNTAAVNTKVIAQMRADSASFDGLANVLLPALEVLQLSLVGHQGALDDECIVSMVKSRWKGEGIASLKTFKLALSKRKFDVLAVVPLKYLAKAGLQVSISDINGVVL